MLVLDFIKKNESVYTEFLKGVNGYPFLCDYSSEILGSYLHIYFKEEPYVISGFYEQSMDEFLTGVNIDDVIESDNNHCWYLLSTGEIIDFTANQFQADYADCPIIINQEDLDYNNYFPIEEYSIPNEFIEIARSNKCFEKYLKELNQYLF